MIRQAREQAGYIFGDWADIGSGWTYREMGKRYGVSAVTMHSLVARRSYTAPGRRDFTQSNKPKLTGDQVRLIRQARVSESPCSYACLAERFGVTKTTIYHVATCRTYKEVR